jgi:hypothetical protein
LAGYSDAPLQKKLGIRDGHVVAWLGAPANFAVTLGALPDGVKVRKGARLSHSLDVIVLFAKTMTSLERALPGAAEALGYAGGLWVAWPKKSSGVKTDVGEMLVRKSGLALGLVDNKVCAIDDTWSGLRFVYRVENRPKAR